MGSSSGSLELYLHYDEMQVREVVVNNTGKGRTVASNCKYGYAFDIFAIAIYMTVYAQSVHGLLYGTLL